MEVKSELDIRYFFEIRHKGKFLSDIPIPKICGSRIFSRSVTIESVNNSKNNLVTPNIATLLKMEGVSMGVCFEYDGKRFPIVGYEGFMKHKDLLKNQEYECRLYRENGWIEGVETEEVYSVHKREMIEVIKHQPENFNNIKQIK